MSDNKFKKVDSDESSEDDEHKRNTSFYIFPKGLSPKYIEFTENHAKFWKMFNLVGLGINILMATAAWEVLGNYKNECGGLKMGCWTLFILYGINFIWQGCALFGVEKLCCNTCGILSVFIFDVLVLAFA